MICANHPDREHKAFCQNCGKPLCTECTRIVGQAVFCEPCLEARLAAANAAAAGSSQPFGAGSGAAGGSYPPPTGTGFPYGGSAAGAPFGPGAVPPTPGTLPPGTPNPVIAFLLGFVPGVSAMYNGQYAKGAVHLIVFAVLVSLADQNGIFGLFVAAWLFYQAFEGYHTARARRDGTPLPNHFGLNDIGERFGFGRAWPTSPPVPGAPLGSDPAAAQPGTPYTAGPAYPSPQAEPAYAAAAAPPPFTAAPFPANSAPWGSPTESFSATVSPTPAPSRFPVGAIVLIGLGVLFLLGSTRMFERFPIHYLLPFLLIGVGVWIFVRRMTATGVSLIDDGSALYRVRLVGALQGSVWIVLVGILFLLDNLRVLSWGRSWPLFIIVGGVMAFIQRSAYTTAARESVYSGYAPVNQPPSPAPAPVAADPGTSIVAREREGS